MTDPPKLIYGTAWKEDATAPLVSLALEAGFRAFDTANQRKHYVEAATGEAVAEAIARGLISRDDVFLQTKYTFRGGQDHRLPYDPSAPIREQVRQSFDRSLEHLRVERIDSYVLHGPSRRLGLHDDDLEAWSAMEALASAGLAGSLGVSNVDRAQLELLCEHASVPPEFVQNRCFAELGWDRDVRASCARRGIAYQGFSLLTANPQVLRHEQVRRLAQAKALTPAQIVFAFAAGIGMIPLTGTTDRRHMEEDLQAVGAILAPEELALVEGLAGAG